jgi:hemerythrin superfamily protein
MYAWRPQWNDACKKNCMNATDMIRNDHSKVIAAFHRYDLAARPQAKLAVVHTVCLALEIHAQLEEEIFYPAMRVADAALIEKSLPEHHEMRRLIAVLRSMEAASEAYDRAFMELMRIVMHHVADEETLLLPEAERVLDGELGRLGARMMRRRLQLMAPRAGELALNTARGLSTNKMLLGAGALLAGAYVLIKSRNPESRRLS